MLVSHIEQIKHGGYKVFRRKLFALLDRFFLILSGVWAIPFVLIMRIFRGVILFRIGTLRSDRIGHFASDSGQQFAANSLNSTNRTVDLYWLSKYISNKQLELMVRRNFLVFNFARYLDFWNLRLPGGEIHMRPSSLTHSRDISGMLEKSNKRMKFLSFEENQAKEWMSSFGWKEGDRFVCLLVRDPAYLKKNDIYKASTNFDYHNYRDSDINNYIKAMEWLANEGVWVFRMGREMLKPIATSHPKIIDYAFSKNQSDLLDIWMFANCDFCISTGSGPDMVSDIYRKPLLIFNCMPLFNLWSWSNATHIPKHLKYIDTGIFLTLSEHIKHSYWTSEQYHNAGIEFHELSSIEILNGVKEFFNKIFKKKEDPSNDDFKKTLWEIILSSDKAPIHHGYIHKDSCIASSFIKNNPNWLK